MPIITPDLSEVKEMGPLPEGVYKGRIEKVEPATWPSGDEFLRIGYTVFGCEGDTASYNGRKVTDSVNFRGKSAWKFEQVYQAAFGEKPGTGQGIDTDSFIGREVELSVGIRIDNQQRQWPDVKAVKALS